MRIKLDENLPLELVRVLAARGHDVHTPRDEGLSGRPDYLVWEAAQRELRFLITQDMDFSDARKFAPGSHNGLLLIRLRSPGREALIARVALIFDTEDVDQWRGCFVVATERKLRVTKP